MTTASDPSSADETLAQLRGLRGASFTADASDYATARPSYPADAVDWLVPSGAGTVLDLAAGTGKLTALLTSRAEHVVAIEPADSMRYELGRSLPGVEALPGTAEQIPVPDASVDAVLVAQAWHWFDALVAASEVSRVLRPGGRLGVVWNVRDDSVGWVAALSEILHRGDRLAAPHHLLESFGPQFEDIETTTFAWLDEIAPSALRPLVASRSHLLTLPDAERESLLAEVDELAATHPDLRGRESVGLPYVTHCYRAARRD